MQDDIEIGGKQFRIIANTSGIDVLLRINGQWRYIVAVDTYHLTSPSGGPKDGCIQTLLYSPFDNSSDSPVAFGVLFEDNLVIHVGDGGQFVAGNPIFQTEDTTIQGEKFND